MRLRIIRSLSSVPKVEIYTKATCPYCIRAKMLLQQKGVPLDEIGVDFGGDKKQEMIQRAGGRMTVPQIFIDGKHVGGCDDLFELESAGKLDELLAA
jgi:glutaredoxin 3